MADDPLTVILSKGALWLLAHAIQAEAEAFLAIVKGMRLPDGRRRLTRHGHSPKREVQIGNGPVTMQRVRLCDQEVDVAGERIRFALGILPRWIRRVPRLDALLPILYLRGVPMPKVVQGVMFTNGVEVTNTQAQNAAC